jgi:hypothetical protein
MSLRGVRGTTAMWMCVSAAWLVAAAVVVTWAVADADLHPAPALLLALLLAVATASALLVHWQVVAHAQREQALSLLREIRAGQPTAAAIAAQAILNADVIKRAEAELPRIGDARR